MLLSPPPKKKKKKNKIIIIIIILQRIVKLKISFTITDKQAQIGAFKAT